MKTFFTKILSFFLAAIILLSTTSFTANMHFCCDHLVDMAFFSKAETCKDEACMDKVQEKDNPFKKCTTLQEKDCCSNKTILKKGDDTFKESNTISETKTLVFINTFLYTYINLFEGLEENEISFQTYRPPLLSKDIQILYETFLI